jgi:ABC-2 type transport system permease protein
MGTRVEDLRYTTYDGDRRRPAACVAALATHSALHALGVGRSWRAKFIPIGLIALCFGPAIVALGLRALFAQQFPEPLTDIVPYEGYYVVISVGILVLAAVITPDMLCPDRRDRVLDLYFATAVSPGQYLTGKVAAALVPLLGATLAPVLFLFGGNVLFALHPLGYLEAHLGDLVRIIAAGFLIASFYGLLGLAIASLTARRAFAMGGVVGLLVASSAASGVLVEGLGTGSEARLLALPGIPIGLARVLFPGDRGIGDVSATSWLVAYAVVCVVSLAILVVRYRGVEE